jgi:hypothetical protein
MFLVFRSKSQTLAHEKEGTEVCALPNCLKFISLLMVFKIIGIYNPHF